MSKYRKKPVVIEAVQLCGNNIQEVLKFANSSFLDKDSCTLKIGTLEGDMVANSGDYIIQGVNGEFYPCKPDIFDKTYKKVVG